MTGRAKTPSEIRAIFSKMGFGSMTDIQEKAVPRILQKRDSLVIAPTGSGKTECVVIPAFALMRPYGDGGKIRCLYITPLRALNRDVFARVTRYAEEMGLTIRIRHGDTPQSARKRIASSPPDVLITTPETAVVLLSQPAMLDALSELQWVVIDEVHELLSSKRGSQLAVTLERLQMNSKYPLTRVGLSATVGNPTEAAKMVAGSRRRCLVLRDAAVRRYNVEIRLEKGGMAGAANVVRSYVAGLKTGSPVLLFANSRGEAETLATILRDKGGMPVELHHGSLSKHTRKEAESMLKGGRRGVVVCTSSLELGIDIGSVDAVIHYESPRQASKLAQRLGRSRHGGGRAAAGLVLAPDLNESMEARAVLDRAARGDVEPQAIHAAPLDVLAHHMVGLLYQEGPTAVRRVLEMARASYPFRNITEEDVRAVLDLLEENRIISLDRRADTYAASSRAFWYHLENLTTIPDIARLRVFDTISKKTVGSLDQRFVGDHGDAGSVFVLRGSRWKILAVNEESSVVNVEPVRGGETTVPYWEGESIPVDQKTAAAVGRMRGQEGVRVRGRTPGSDVILAEVGGHDRVVLHACFGTRINRTISAILSDTVSASGVSKVQARSDAYRIYLTGSGHVSEEAVRGALTAEYDLHEAVTAAVSGGHDLNWRVWIAAKRFGVIRRADAYERRRAAFIRSRYAGTPLMDEAMRDLFHDRYDVEGAGDVLSRMRDGSITMSWMRVDKFSELAGPVLGHASAYRPGSAIDPEILGMLKRRLYDTQHRLVCARCGGWQTVAKTSEIARINPCPRCGARQITATYYSDYDLADVISRKRRGEKVSGQEEARYKKAWKVASLIETFGTTAIMVLSGYGVGAQTAGRILRDMVNEEYLFRQIYEAERLYVTTRAYWD